MVKTHGLSKTDKEKIRDEILLIQKLNHPKIIHFINAWHNQKKEEVVFITEIMTGGSLKQYLKKFKHPHLRVIKQWCKDILEGLKYLHSQKPYPLIHRDLKCENIFVSSSTGDVRIGDLGLSTFMKNSHNKTILGTPQYMAPELYEERYGPSVDIYSFGMCVLEMCTHLEPYLECSTPLEIYNKVTNGIKPQSLEKIADPEVKEFIELCLLPVDQRPHADELLTHSFLKIQEDDVKVHLPVSLKDDENEIKLDINIGIRDPYNNKTAPIKISFLFNQNNDTVKSISEEIISVFKIDPKYSESLTTLIKKKLIDRLDEDSNKKDLRKDKNNNLYFTKSVENKH